MYREAVLELEEWINSKAKKPLMITGCKKVGKTWTALDLGAAYFESTVLVDLQVDNEVKKMLNDQPNLKQIVRFLGKKSNVTIDTKKTFIIFDNVNCLRKTYDFIEFLNNEMYEYSICCISNVINDTERLSQISYIKEIYPFTFQEFLIVNKENELCSKVANQKDEKIEDELLKKLEEYIKIFMIVGGMPESVKSWIESKDFYDVESTKNSILKSYFQDFESIKNIALRKKVYQIWESIPKQLDRDVKKFHFDIVKLTARKREYIEALEWLLERKYIYKINMLEKTDAFEIFLPDIGFLSKEYELEKKSDNDTLEILEFKNGALKEQFIFQELRSNRNIEEIFYWNSKATARIEFVFRDGNNYVPIKINLKSNNKMQSMKVFIDKYKSPFSVYIKYNELSKHEKVLNIPLYGVWNL